MANTTTEIYSVDGVELNTYAWNLSTLTGRMGTSPVVGENRTIVGRPGTSWQRKEFGERIETWAMWVAGCDDDGVIPTLFSERAGYNKNLDDLKRVFGVRHRELELQKILEFPDGPVTYTGKGEVIDVIEPSMIAYNTVAAFTVTMLMCDPFWYLPEEIEVITGAGVVLNNPGTAIAQKLSIKFTGPLTFPRLTNTTLGVMVRLNRTLGVGEEVTLDTDLFTAVTETSNNAISSVFQYGSDWWMELIPGNNTLTLDNSNGGALGAGSVTLTYLPPSI